MKMGDLSNEPSMEDILASIKKIIADDGDRVAPSAPPPRPIVPRDISFDEMGSRITVETGAVDDDDVLELGEAALEPQVTPRADPPQEPRADIMSEATAEASRSALSSLSRMVVKPEVAGSDTLEGMVRDMLRPMLKDWLDANLPDVVERVVAKEVARISGR